MLCFGPLSKRRKSADGPIKSSFWCGPPEATRVCCPTFCGFVSGSVTFCVPVCVVCHANEMSVTMLNANFVEAAAQLTPFSTSSPGSSFVEASSPAPQLSNRVTTFMQISTRVFSHPGVATSSFSHFDLEISPKSFKIYFKFQLDSFETFKLLASLTSALTCKMKV